MKVFLTGASAGIGAETAKLLCQSGHEVWGSSRSIERLPVMKGFHPVQLDLLSADSISAAAAKVWDESGGVDVLINNAGQASFGPLEQLPAESLRREFELLFVAPLILQQNLMSRMRQGGGGLIINVTSMATELPIPFMGSYSAAKAALSAASTAMRLEMADDRVRCIDLRPGDIGTDFNDAVTRTPGHESKAAEKAWKTIEKNMAGAPPALMVAEKILEIVESRHPAPVNRVGDWFQTTLAPWGPKLLPAAWLERLIRKYYGLS